jgi:YD repeat-containing protein
VRRLIELFLLCIVLFAVGYQLSAQDEDLFAFTVGKEEDRSLAPPPATFIPKEYAICNPQLPKVNVITGEYCEEECDLIVAGTEPLSYRRFYDHLGHKDTVYGHWRINPECFMLLNFELSRFCHRDYQKLAGCGREDGSIILYERGVDNAYVFDLFKHPNWTHTSESGRKHPLNTNVTFETIRKKIGSARVRTIIDDGNSDNPSDLTSVTYHRILEITPKRTLPCLGLPEQIREKTIDEQGNETLLKKVCYTYHPSGKIVREEHYNASDEYSYSIVNTYDDKERLIATTDPLGNKTTFKYDNNFNLITQSGPRADVYKEWVYDRANRPIEEKEWQTDGTILTTKKKYDKASRVVATIDESGFETRYEHDALGRITVIHHPDGACEKKYMITSAISWKSKMPTVT